MKSLDRLADEIHQQHMERRARVKRKAFKHRQPPKTAIIAKAAKRKAKTKTRHA